MKNEKNWINDVFAPWAVSTVISINIFVLAYISLCIIFCKIKYQLINKNIYMNYFNNIDFIEIYMFLVAIMGSFLFYLQAYKIIKNKSSRNVSLTGFLFSFITSVSWLFYGVYKNVIPLIFSGSLCAVGASLVLTGILYYRN